VSPLFRTPGATRSASEASAFEAAGTNGGPPQPSASSSRLQGVSGLATARPEFVVAAAFAGGIALAIFARRLGR
jgi:hypothetical protein